MREVERRFSPEFRNRIDEVVIFDPLTREEVETIARQHIERLTATLKARQKTLRLDPDALRTLADEGYSLEYGARFLKRVVDRRIKLPISLRWTEGSRFAALVSNGEVVVELEAETSACAAGRTRSGVSLTLRVAPREVALRGLIGRR